MRAAGAILLSTADELFAVTNPRFLASHGDSPRLESGPGEHEKAPQLVLVHLANGLDDIWIKRHMGKWVL
jgi:hypothetical protein